MECGVVYPLQEVKSQPQNLVADTLLAGEDPWTARCAASSPGIIIPAATTDLYAILSSILLPPPNPPPACARAWAASAM